MSIRRQKSRQVFQKLSSQDKYTDVFKKHIDGSSADVAGDYVDNPLKAVKLLQGTGYSGLNIPLRAADFKSEVTWRLQLRDNIYK